LTPETTFDTVSAPAQNLIQRENFGSSWTRVFTKVLSLTWKLLKKPIAFLCNASALQVISVAPYSVSLGCALVWLVVKLQVLLQKGTPHSHILLLLTVSGIGSISALGLAITLHWLPLSPASKLDTRGTKTYLLAMQLGMLLVCIPVFLLVWRTPEEAMT